MIDINKSSGHNKFDIKFWIGPIILIIIIVVLFYFILKDTYNKVDNYDDFRGGGRRGGGGFRGGYRGPRIIYGGNPYILPPHALLTLDNEDHDEKDVEIERLKKELASKFKKR